MVFLVLLAFKTKVLSQVGDDDVFTSVAPKRVGNNPIPEIFWENASSWTRTYSTDSDGIPDAGDDVIIVDADHKVIVRDVRFVKKLTFKDGNGTNYDHTVELANVNSSLTVAGDIYFQMAPNSAVTSIKTLDVGVGTLQAAYLKMDISQKAKNYSKVGKFIISSGKATILNDIDLNINAPGNNINENFVQLTDNGTLWIGGDFLAGLLQTMPDKQNTVRYYSARNQKVKEANYQNLYLENAGTKLLMGASSIGSSLMVTGSAIFDIGSFLIDGTAPGKYMKVENGARLRIGNDKTFPKYYLDPVLELNSTVEYYGFVQAVDHIPKYGNLEISGSSTNNTDYKTAQGDLTIRNNLTININGIFRSHLSGQSPFMHTIGGNWSNSGSFIGDNSTIDFINTSNIQTISGSSTTVFNNLKLSKQGKDLWLNTPIGVNGTLMFSDGLINSGPSNKPKVTFNANSIYLNASIKAFINGPAAKVGNSSFIFPVGKELPSLKIYAPIGISFTETTAPVSEFETEYFPVSALTLGTGRVSKIKYISNCEYWNFKRNGAGTATPDVTLFWKPNTVCAGASYIVNAKDIQVAGFNSKNTTPGTWDIAEGEGAGDSNSGSVTFPKLSSFVPLTFASIASISALPIRFANLTATEQAAGVQVAFSNMTEEDVAKYYIERSADGNQFSVVGSLAPRLNNNQRADYTFLDAAPLHGDNYYRIRGVETTGKTIYSDVVRLVVNAKGQGLHIYPNPARVNSTVQLQLGVLPAGKYQLHVYNQNGQAVRATSFVHTGGNVSTPVSTMGMAPGRYLVQLSGAQKRVRTLVLH